MLQRRITGGVTRSVLLAMKYDAPDGTEAPLVADIRLRIDGPGVLTGVGVSPLLLEAGKELRADSETGRPFSDLGDGVSQVLIWSPGRHRPLTSGDWLFFDVMVGDGTSAPTAPVVVSLVAREGILAPQAADEGLWTSPLSTPLVLWAR